MSTTQQFSQAASPSLTIRFSTPADAASLVEFYQTNSHHHVDNRGDAVFADRANSGRAFLIVKPDGKIGMSSISHPYDHIDVVEIGSTLTTLPGMSMYPFTISSQIVYEFLERPPTNRFFADIHKENIAVTKMLNRKVGWHLVTVTDDFAKAVGEEVDKVDWLHADSDTLGTQARIVLAAIDKGTVLNRNTGEEVRLDFSQFPLAGVYRKHVEELASGRFGEMLESSRHIPLKNARQVFERYLSGATYFPELSPKP